jgi:TolB-like protein/Flp pilus assembly protein TadD
MKRCPECRRDYYDDSLLYCLDDGTALLEGPASGSEPTTAILHEIVPPAEAPTRAQIHDAEHTTILPRGTALPRSDRSLSSGKIAALIALVAVLIVGGFVGYRYFAPSSKQIESVAVMPFVNDSGNPDVDYLSDGMTETLISNLSQLPNLNVKSRSSVFRYKGKEMEPQAMGKELNVQAILTGRVVQRGPDMSLFVELIDVDLDTVVWSQKYNAKRSDLVSLQGEIALDVSSNLKTKLSGADEAKLTKKYTESTEAFQLYLKGRYFWNKRTAEGMKNAIEQFQQAIDNDPNYALAYAGLADCFLLMQWFGDAPTSEVVPKAKAAALRALQIDDSLAEANSSLGLTYTCLWQWGDAEMEFRRAIQLNPNYPTAHDYYTIFLTEMERLDEALAEINRAQELDPLSGIITSSAARTYILRGDLDAAIAVCKNFIELDPNFPQTHVFLALAYQRQGLNEGAVAEAQIGVELSRRGTISLGVLGYCYALAGRRSNALAILSELEKKRNESGSRGAPIAWVYTGLGDKEQAFAWLEKDFQDRSGILALQIKGYPILGALQSDVRYADLLRRMGLPT